MISSFVGFQCVQFGKREEMEEGWINNKTRAVHWLRGWFHRPDATCFLQYVVFGALGVYFAFISPFCQLQMDEKMIHKAGSWSIS